MHGSGKIHFEDDSYYDGDWKHGIMEGFGKEIEQGSFMYRGEYVGGSK